ncbi:hypothetical protein OVY01_04145 [Robbsia sp. Bb-Pol-6]|uniref:Uncharacterized protein n=1 Tax=Robbsia betulipollinis TaxID=2981849 RepID=A0ABT3ZIT7_9BURK|nr:hypothetical protein [Robbsia betulipollinis]MCY0386444.1 hypothetical protein [Robbsia betulipollinis]
MTDKTALPSLFADDEPITGQAGTAHDETETVLKTAIELPSDRCPAATLRPAKRVMLAFHRAQKTTLAG